MPRKPWSAGSRLEALMGERDDLLVAISLERDAPSPNTHRIAAIRKRLFQLENEIEQNAGDGSEQSS